MAIIRKNITKYLAFLILSFCDLADETPEEEDKDDEDELGGLFRILKNKSEKNKSDRATVNKVDCSKFEEVSKHDWDLEEVLSHF